MTGNYSNQKCKRFNSKLDDIKERICELEYRIIEITQLRHQRENRLKKSAESLETDYNKRFNTYLLSTHPG